MPILLGVVLFLYLDVDELASIFIPNRNMQNRILLRK